MAHFSTDRLISIARRLASMRFVGGCLPMLLVSLICAAEADAGVIVGTEFVAMGGSTFQGPAPPNSDSTVNQQETLSVALLGVTSDGGMSSSSQSGGSTSAGVVGLAHDLPLPPTTCLVSRLSLFSRISLPDPVEGRFFRPPR